MCVPCPRFSQDLGSIEKAVWKIRRLGALDRRRSSDSPRSALSRPHLFHYYLYFGLKIFTNIYCLQKSTMHVYVQEEDGKNVYNNGYFLWHKCKTFDSFPVNREEKDCALYEDVGTICTVLPAAPRRATYTEKTERTELVQVPPTERLKICNVPILWWFCTLIRTTSPHTLVVRFTLYYQRCTWCAFFISDIWYYFKLLFGELWLRSNSIKENECQSDIPYLTHSVSNK